MSFYDNKQIQYHPEYSIHYIVEDMFALIAGDEDKNELLERWAQHGSGFDNYDMNDKEKIADCEAEQCFISQAPIYETEHWKIQTINTDPRGEDTE